MEKSELNPKFCGSPMFLRTLGPARKRKDARNNKVTVDQLVVQQEVTLDKDPIAECTAKGVELYNRISGYHQSMSLNRTIPDSKAFSFGVELEAMFKTFHDSFNSHYRELLRSNWIFGARDGSLPTQMSVELATIPLSAPYALDFTVWRDLTNHLRKFLYSHASYESGLHTHIGTQYLLPSHPLYDKDKWCNALTKAIQITRLNLQPQQREARNLLDEFRVLIDNTMQTSSYYAASSRSDTQDPEKIAGFLYNILRHQTNCISLASLYTRIADSTGLMHLPYITLNSPLLPGYRTSRCGTTGSFLLRSDARLTAASQCEMPSGSSRTPAESAFRRAMDALSFDYTRAETVVGSTLAMNERSAAKGTRDNVLRARLAPASYSEWDHGPFLHVLFGRSHTHYCSEIEVTGDARFERTWLSNYPLDEEYLHLPPQEFLDFLTRKTGVTNSHSNLTTAIRALLFQGDAYRLSLYERHMRWNLNHGRSLDELASTSLDTENRISNGKTLYFIHLHNYLKHYWPDPDTISDIFDQIVRSSTSPTNPPTECTPTQRIVLYCFYYKLIARLSQAISSHDHHDELCSTDNTLEFRRGKGTLNPQRIHAILTFLYYLSSTAAAAPITPSSAEKFLPDLCKALYTQEHSPLLSHLALSCLPPAYTGATMEEALYRSAPAVTLARNED